MLEKLNRKVVSVIKIKTLFILTIFIATFARADVVILNNGTRIETQSAWEEDGQIKCYRWGQVVGYPKENVRKIDVSRKKTDYQRTKKLPKQRAGDDAVGNHKDLSNISSCEELIDYEIEITQIGSDLFQRKIELTTLKIRKQGGVSVENELRKIENQIRGNEIQFKANTRE